MQLVFRYLMLACASAAFSWTGRQIRTHPEATAKLMTFGQASTGFSTGLCRFAGVLFYYSFAFGVIFHLVLMIFNLLGVVLGK